MGEDPFGGVADFRTIARRLMRLDARGSSVSGVALQMQVIVLAEVCFVIVGKDPFGGLLDFAETTVRGKKLDAGVL